MMPVIRWHASITPTTGSDYGVDWSVTDLRHATLVASGHALCRGDAERAIGRVIDGARASEQPQTRSDSVGGIKVDIAVAAARKYAASARLDISRLLPSGAYNPHELREAIERVMVAAFLAGVFYVPEPTREQPNPST